MTKDLELACELLEPDESLSPYLTDSVLIHSSHTPVFSPQNQKENSHE